MESTKDSNQHESQPIAKQAVMGGAVNPPILIRDGVMLDKYGKPVMPEIGNIEQIKFLEMTRERIDHAKKGWITVDYKVEPPDEEDMIGFYDYFSFGRMQCICNSPIIFEKGAKNKNDRNAYPTFLHCGFCGCQFKLSRKPDPYIPGIDFLTAKLVNGGSF